MPIRTILLLGALLCAQGCSYAVSPEIKAQADRTIPFEKLSAEPRSFAGKTVILGGEIVRIQSTKSGTLIEVLQKELDYWGKPRRTERTGGRFIVSHRAMLDAMVYAPGREITVAGEVTGTEQQGLGEDVAAYPLLQSRELKLWPRERPTSDRPQWLDPLHDPRSKPGNLGY
jgi:outer membrane lipoprotein